MSAATGYEGILKQEPSLQFKLGEERIELASKIERLKSFMTTSPVYKTLSRDHVSLLDDQLEAMKNYEDILVTRMSLLNLENQ